MRKLLLASAAMLGATAGMISAQAQSSDTRPATVSGPQALQGQVNGPYLTGASYNNQSNSIADIKTYQGNVAGLGSDGRPEPGTVVIHLHGKVEADFMATYGTGNNLPGGQQIISGSGTLTGVANSVTNTQLGGGITPAAAFPGQVTTAPTAAAKNVITNGAKLNPVSASAYMRLYPGIDAMATNGLRYGAQIELRENFASSGGEPYPSQNGLSPASSRSGQTVFVNRSYAYISADNIGMVRIGQADGVIGLFDPCIFSGACWDAGVGVFQSVAGALGPAANAGLSGSYFVMAQNGNEYGNAKIVYVSPQIAGFDLGLQFAPNQSNSFATCNPNQAVLTGSTTSIGSSATGASGCANTTTGNDSTSALNSGSTRWYNQFGVGLRYQGVFGPLSVGAYGFYEYAAIEKVNGLAAGAGGPATFVGGSTQQMAYKGAYAPLSWYQFAAYGKYASPVGTFIVSADYVGGAISSGSLTPKPNSGVNESGFMPGITYNNGPLTLGVSGFFLTSQGAAQLTGISQRQETGLALGGNYNVAPGLFLVAEYQYTTRHQGGYDFTEGVVSAPGTNGQAVGFTRDARANSFFTGVVVNW
jgi:Gram-negative porin